jgi:hypothetical protein
MMACDRLAERSVALALVRESQLEAKIDHFIDSCGSECLFDDHHNRTRAPGSRSVFLIQHVIITPNRVPYYLVQ